MTRDIVPKLLPSVAGHYFLRHIELPAVSAELPGLPMALPLGELASECETERARPLTMSIERSDMLPLRKALLIAV